MNESRPNGFPIHVLIKISTLAQTTNVCFLACFVYHIIILYDFLCDIIIIIKTLKNGFNNIFHNII